MANRWLVGLSAVITLFIPIAVHAGVGGSPVPPGAAAAGAATAYCCATWTPSQIGDNKASITVFNGTGCVAIAATPSEVNDCGTTNAANKVLKCRGEQYTPGAPLATPDGLVDRCLTP